MGISDYRIRKIKSVRAGDAYCPNCGKKTFRVSTDTGDYGDVDLSYCPHDKIFFECDDGYFMDGSTEGSEKITKSSGKFYDYWGVK